MQRGHLEHRGGDRWRYRAPGLPGPDGKRRPHSLTFHAPNAKAAGIIATSLLAKWDTGDSEAQAAVGTVANLVKEWQEVVEGKQSPATVHRNQSIIAAINKDLGRIKLNELNARHIDLWLGKLGDTRSPATVHHYYRVLHAILERGYRWDQLVTNVADKATPPRAPRKSQEDRMPTIDALNVILRDAAQTVRVAVQLAATTGARRGELMALRWSDLRGDTLVISRAIVKVPGKPMVEKGTKSGAVKSIQLPVTMLNALEDHRLWQQAFAKRARGRKSPDPRILANLRADPSGATPYMPDWLSQEWERLNDKAGTRFKFHGLRHMHGTLLVDDGVPLASVAKRQGHSVAVAADRYIHSVAASDVAATLRVGELTAALFEPKESAETS